MIKNRKILALVQVALAVFLFWAFYSKNAPGFYLLVLLHLLFWRDAFLEMISGTQPLDTTVFGVRWGQIIYRSLEGIYFIATLLLLTFILWRAAKNLFSKG